MWWFVEHYPCYSYLAPASEFTLDFLPTSSSQSSHLCTSMKGRNYRCADVQWLPTVDFAISYQFVGLSQCFSTVWRLGALFYIFYTHLRPIQDYLYVIHHTDEKRLCGVKCFPSMRSPLSGTDAGVCKVFQMFLSVSSSMGKAAEVVLQICNNMSSRPLNQTHTVFESSCSFSGVCCQQLVECYKYQTSRFCWTFLHPRLVLGMNSPSWPDGLVAQVVALVVWDNVLLPRRWLIDCSGYNATYSLYCLLRPLVLLL